MAVSVDAAMAAAAGPVHNPLLAAAASLTALGNDALKLQVLLGSPPPGSITDVSSGYTTVLKASVDFIRTVYNTRWRLTGVPPLPAASNPTPFPSVPRLSTLQHISIPHPAIYLNTRTLR
jgi:hypothetical protein